MTPDEMSRDDSRDEDDVDGTAATTGSRGPKAGARLKAARQARNISIDEIARELHLDTDKLRALEANRFEVFSAPVFTKGYLRRYAGLVGVPEDEVLAGFEELSDLDGPPPVVIKSPPPRPRSLPSLRTLALVLLAVLLALLGWWAFSGAVLKPVEEVAGDAAGESLLPARDEASRRVAAATETPARSSVAANPDRSSAGEADDGGADAETGMPAQDAAAAADVPVVADTAESSAGSTQSAPAEVALTLSFTDECWLQVTDGDGKRLFAGIARGGQVRRFSAAPPVSLVLGNADVASIEVDGEPYPIDPADRRGRTARITVSGS